MLRGRIDAVEGILRADGRKEEETRRSDRDKGRHRWGECVKGDGGRKGKKGAKVKEEVGQRYD